MTGKYLFVKKLTIDIFYLAKSNHRLISNLSGLISELLLMPRRGDKAVSDPPSWIWSPSTSSLSALQQNFKA